MKMVVNVHPIERWLSVVGGGALAVSALGKGARGIPRFAAGAAMMHRGLTGYCGAYRIFGVRTAPSDATIPYRQGVRVRAATTIDGPRDEIYLFWRQLENLPLFMKHLKGVEIGADGYSHWLAEGPAGSKVRWTAEIINEIDYELIAWKSRPGGDVDSAGSVRFKDAPGGRGTEIHIDLQYNPPAGFAGAFLAKLFGKDPQREIESDLRRLKQYLESGEVATTQGQPQGASA
jgi:uncharacterized membrane protein